MCRQHMDQKTSKDISETNHFQPMSLKKKLSVTKGITESPEAKLPGFFLTHYS
jgi:hypothetical protein